MPNWYAPPIRTIRSIFSVIRGSRRIAIATFERGPTGTIVMSPSPAMTVSIIRSTACLGSISMSGGPKDGPSSPLVPCISPAVTCCRTMGRDIPAATGMFLQRP